MKHTLLLYCSFSIFISAFCQKSNFSTLKGTQTYTIDYPSFLKSILTTKKISISTSPETNTIFQLTQSNTLPETLRKKYPSIHSFRGECSSNKHLTIRLDINENDIHGWINGPENFFFKTIDKKQILVYSEFEYRKAFPKEKHEEIVLRKNNTLSTDRKTRLANKSYTGTLRTYRLAVACTGEYTAYHGGSKALALSAITTSINRINEVYERDLGIRFELVPNNDEIIYLNASTDPFTNDNPNTLINESQTEIDKTIGTNNYDIGHTFSTEGGGLADWASVCSEYKAGGITGATNPIGDPFDIDYVAHEIGHQFGADHTFHSETGSCSDTKVTNSAYEVGSGTTVMAYAGLCEPHNTQSNSSPYFHAKSIEAIQLYLSGRGGTCGTSINNNNTAPTIQLQNNTYTIPTATPFELTASASDNEDTTLTYCWEQYDLGNGTDPLNPQGNDPVFRSFDPSISGTRYFPQLTDVLTNTTTFGEYLPSYERTLNFRVTVRDNHQGGGATNYEKVEITTINTPTPFLITSQNTAASYSVNQNIEVTWDVSNTDITPINADKLNISLSLDGGLSFTTILKNTPNDGSEIITLPSSTTTNARIKLQPTNNIFYAINNTDFEIVPPTYPSFGMISYSNKNIACANDSIQLTIETTSFFSFSNPISISFPNLPSGVEILPENNNIIPGETLTLWLKTNGFSGEFNLEIAAIADTITITNTLLLQLYASNNLNTPTIEFPLDKSLEISNKPEFKWSLNNLATHYTLQLSENENFSNPTTLDYLPLNFILYPESLTPLTTYYWKIKSHNECGQSTFSNATSFVTAPTYCEKHLYNTPLPLKNGQSDFYASITVPNANTITNVSIPNIKGTHEWTSDLYLSLISPSQQEIALFGYICDGNFSENFDIGFSDTSTLGIAPCPPNDGLIYSTSQSLSSLNGENSSGEWQLHIYDEFPSVDEGSLISWELEICTENVVSGFEDPTPSLAYCYPNPSKNTLHITGIEPLDGINIINSIGQTVLTTKKTPIDISSLPTGFYMYIGKIKGEETRGKFQKIK